MLALCLALASAATWGVSDFAGGLASRRTTTVAVLVGSTAVGLVGILAAALATGGAPTLRAGLAGGLAGLAGFAGIGLLYRGLGVGPMHVVAPLSAVAGALVPVAAGLLAGERPGLLAVPGTVLALLAVALVSGAVPAPGGGRAAGDRAGVRFGLGAGVGFGLFFVALDHAGDDSGLWPVVAARAAAVVVALVLVLLLRRRGRVAWRPPTGALPLVVAAGLLDTGANVLFLHAVRAGLLSLVAVVVSLYPAGTVLLAAVVLHERIRRVQVLGLALAAAGVALLAAA